MTADAVLILYRNWLWEPGVLMSASTQARPAARLLEYRPSRAWQATGCASEWVQADFGQARMHRYAAVVAHNLDARGTITFQVGNDPSFTTWSAKVTSPAWLPVAGFGLDGFGVSLGGYPVLSDWASYRAYTFADFGVPVRGRYLRVTFVNPSLASGAVAAGVVWSGLGWQPDWNFALAYDNTWTDPSDQTETEDSVVIRRRVSYRVIKLQLLDLTPAEAIGAMDDVNRITGKSRPLLVSLFPQGAGPQLQRNVIYGLRTDDTAISGTTTPAIYASGLTIRELAA